MMNDVLECAGWKQNSCDDGPGIRSVLFLQGCTANCPGCHNRPIQKRGAGTFFTHGELLDAARSRCRNRRITVSGGEPLEQRESLASLLSLLSRDGFEICLYTGKELRDVPREILRSLTYLKTGRFEADRRQTAQKYVGSANQRFFRIVDGAPVEISLA